MCFLKITTIISHRYQTSGGGYMALQVGDIITFERTFTLKDVELFTKISGDEGEHH